MSVYYADEAVTLHHGDALQVLCSLPDASVDCCVTSPPYFGLRDYGEAGQYGLEASPAEYVETIRAVFTEVWRVLDADGTLWLNLGDTYGTAREQRAFAFDRPSKSLLGIPWRVAFALQDDGWLLRQEIIWAKANCMPEAVTDRPSRNHEQVFLFSKRPGYWYDADAIREESDPEQVAHNERYAKVYDAQAGRAATTGQPGNQNNAGIHSRPGKPGRNARSVWNVNAQPLAEAHFAVMPRTLAERCVQAGCKPDGVVLDPFSGSGTTGLAAAKHGRRYVGVDLSADYLEPQPADASRAEVTTRRWCRMTVHHAHICAAKDCAHGQLSHRYQITTKTNCGECQSPNCPCTEFEAAPFDVNSAGEGGRIEQADEVRQYPIGSNRPTRITEQRG